MGKAVDKNAYYNLRFERKFVFTNQSLEDVLNFTVHTNSFLFSEIFHERTVNNIYFDDGDLTCYKQNVSGVDIREKYRLRWYGKEFHAIEKSTLEVKKKFGDVGDKISFKLKDFNVDLRTQSADAVHNQLLQRISEENNPALLGKLQNLFPTLYNSYDRRYFLSQCGNFRITLDYHMKFYNPNYADFYASEMTTNDVVLELKYNREHDDESRLLSQEINSRLSKNSKYVRGVEAISF
ncbi:polyphosphate polymerase domain-containing protein [Cochleicola gelatinilyticus]|nr:polyphosphate polymerase domain-containing protein [Cochleicola gelatinilyticus]